MQVQAQVARIEEKNFHVFTERQFQSSRELEQTLHYFQKNPDFGILPYNSPIEAKCVELIERRDAFSRYFVEKGSGGSHFYQQKSHSPINYQDQDKNWREINYRLQPNGNGSGIYSSSQQPSPFSISLTEKFARVQSKGHELIFNKSLSLIRVDENGIEHSLGQPDWSRYTAGDDGIRVFDFYPGIDLVFMMGIGTMETNFILTRRLPYSSGYLVMKQGLEFSDGLSLVDPLDLKHKTHREVYISANDRVPVFTIEKCYAYDNNRMTLRQELEINIFNDSIFQVFAPLQWLSDPTTVYPVVIDPIVTTQNSIAAGTIAGTQFSPVCWTNSCDYFLTVPTPANATILNIYASFEYLATGACFAQDGGFSIDFGTCTFPQAAPGVITCAFPISNFNCGIVAATTLPDFTACIPPPQCSSQNFDFTLHFYRCNNDPSVICGNACVRAAQPWLMTVEGRTFEMNYNSPLQIICGGDSVNVVTVLDGGVGPYLYNWSPVSSNNDTIIVSPAVTTDYTVTATDACGTTASGISTVQVTTYNNPGFSASPATICIGQPLTLTGFGAGAASSYDWIVPGSNAAGGIITNSQNPIVQYSLPGTYSITLNYTSGSCVFDSTISITVDGLNAAQVNLVSSPAGAVCPGDSVSFNASVLNGGAGPTFDWYIDGVLVQTGAVDSMQSNNFVNGSLVQVVLTSNSSCANPLVDTASLFIVFSVAVSPAVTISPDTLICPGSNVTFTATPGNGGATPAFQWTINGVSIAGATGNTFNTNLSVNDSVVGVIMTSSLSCVVSSNATDTTHVQFETPAQPIVAIAAQPAGAVCAGDTINFTAQSTWQGTSPLFEWYVNGISTGPASNDSTFSIINPAQGDSVSVELISSYACVLSNTANSWSIISVTAAASPFVSIAVQPSLSICEDDTALFTASGSAAGSSPDYSWYVNGVLQSSSDSIFSSSSLNDQDVVSVILISSLSCAILPSDTDAVVISVSPVSNPLISIVESGSGACEGDTIQWTATISNGGNAPLIDWTVNGISQSVNSTTFSYFPVDGDTIQATLNSSSACVIVPNAQSNVLLVNLSPYVTPAVTIHASPFDTICAGQNVSLTSTIQNGGNIPTYQWTVNSTPSGSNSPSLSSSTFEHNDIIQLTLISDAPCLTQDSTQSNFIRILTYQAIVVQVSGTGNLCPGTPIELVASAFGGDGGPYTYAWTHTIDGNDTITVIPEFSTQYVVNVYDNCPNSIGTDTFQLSVLQGPQSAMTYSPDDPSTFNNTVSFRNLSSNSISWQWDFGDSTLSTLVNPVHIYDSAGTYDVSLISYAANGCIDTVYYRIVVREDIAVFFPNAFSPDGDMTNEYWQPIGESLQQYHFSILDRWGQVIFEGDQSTPWDGRVKNNTVPAQNGVYIYYVDLMDSKFGKQVVTGRVTLIR